jgi:hypothetical protein
LVLTAALAACGGATEATEPPTTIGPDESSGEDRTIAGALDLNVTPTDTVDVAEGDSTDHRFLDLAEAGNLTLELEILDGSMAGQLSLTDEYGSPLIDVPFGESDNVVQLRSIFLQPGRYYVRVAASTGAAQYTLSRVFVSETDLADFFTDLERISIAVDVDYHSDHPAVQARLDEIRQHAAALAFYDTDRNNVIDQAEFRIMLDIITQEVATYEHSARRERARRHRHSGEAAEPSGAAVEPPPPARAVIQAIRRQSGGTILVLSGCGEDSGVAVGDAGEIDGTTFSVEVIAIRGGSCDAASEARVEDLESALYVRF